MVMFDLPVLTKEQRRRYAVFRKTLIREGFMMMQESVYCKLLLNASATELLANRIEKEIPDEGLVQMLTITEKQYVRMKSYGHLKETGVIDSDERTVFL